MAPKESRDYLELTTQSIAAFADDGRLDVEEFDELMSIALRDNVIDDNEKRVLGNIINRLTTTDLTPELRLRIHDMRQQHGF